jgi:hypothetical protein
MSRPAAVATSRIPSVRRFKFMQEVADKVDAFIDDHPPTHDIAGLEQKQRLRLRKLCNPA